MTQRPTDCTRDPFPHDGGAFEPMPTRFWLVWTYYERGQAPRHMMHDEGPVTSWDAIFRQVDWIAIIRDGHPFAVTEVDMTAGTATDRTPAALAELRSNWISRYGRLPAPTDTYVSAETGNRAKCQETAE